MPNGGELDELDTFWNSKNKILAVVNIVKSFRGGRNVSKSLIPVQPLNYTINFDGHHENLCP